MLVACCVFSTVLMERLQLMTKSIHDDQQYVHSPAAS